MSVVLPNSVGILGFLIVVILWLAGGCPLRHHSSNVSVVLRPLVSPAVLVLIGVESSDGGGLTRFAWVASLVFACWWHLGVGTARLERYWLVYPWESKLNLELRLGLADLWEFKTG